MSIQQSLKYSNSCPSPEIIYIYLLLQYSSNFLDYSDICIKTIMKWSTSKMNATPSGEKVNEGVISLQGSWCRAPYLTGSSSVYPGPQSHCRLLRLSEWHQLSRRQLVIAEESGRPPPTPPPPDPHPLASTSAAFLRLILKRAGELLCSRQTVGMTDSLCRWMINTTFSHWSADVMQRYWKTVAWIMVLPVRCDITGCSYSSFGVKWSHGSVTTPHRHMSLHRNDIA